MGEGRQVAKALPAALWVGAKVVWNLAKIKKRAERASKRFQKTLVKEGVPKELAKAFAEEYRLSIPVPGLHSIRNEAH